jgi:SPP1 gp7 family putative phage head morphogenesis protein
MRKKPPQVDEALAPVAAMSAGAMRELRRNYNKALEVTKRKLGRLYEKYAKEGSLTYAEMTKYNRLQALHADLVRDFQETFRVNGHIVKKLAEDAYEASYFRMGWQIMEGAKVEGRWGLLPPNLIKIATQKPYSGLTLSEVWTRAKAGALSDIERAVVQGMVQGDSYPNMAKRVQAAFDTNKARAELIARTEAHRLAVEAQKDAYDRAAAMGIDMQQIWDATLDDRTRDSHADMDGKAAENVGTEDDPRYQWDMPGVGWVDGPGLTGVASEDINCRCRVTGEVAGFEPQFRISRDAEGRNEITPYQTYEEWAQTQDVK